MTNISTSDPTFTYHNTFENTLTSRNNQPAEMSYPTDPKAPLNDPSLQRFTATGRPYPNPKSSKESSGMSGLATAESFGQTAPNLLPFRYTDDSIISIAVLPPTGSNANNANADADEDQDSNPVRQSKSKNRFSFSALRRKSLSKNKELEFVMKDVTRGEYLKRYAKDDDGKYIGTEKPAKDCILRERADIIKFRKAMAYREARGATDGMAFFAPPGAL